MLLTEQHGQFPTCVEELLCLSFKLSKPPFPFSAKLFVVRYSLKKTYLTVFGLLPIIPTKAKKQKFKKSYKLTILSPFWSNSVKRAQAIIFKLFP
jgi:hypothetical protein